MQAIVVTLDRLATSALGCYGNEWIETPHLDRLASEAVVFDRHFTEHVGASAGTSLGTGQFPFGAASRLPLTDSAWSNITAAAGVELHLLRECDAQPWSRALETTTCSMVATQPVLDPKPDEIPFAHLVRTAMETLASPRGTASRIVWLHSAGVPEPWLPPEGFATLYFEDYEERGCEMAAVTRDNWGTHPAVYAGYVSLIDHWLGELLTAVKKSAVNEPTLLVFVAARGCDWTKEPGPRREFLELDDDESPAVTDLLTTDLATDDAASAERISTPATLLLDVAPVRIHQPAVPRPTHSLTEAITRTPLFLRLFDGASFDVEFAGTRSNRLVQTADLAATLLHFFQLPSAPAVTDGRSLLNELNETEPPRAMVCFTDGDGSRGIRTADWSCLIQDEPLEQESTVQLFAKPEDYWEVNDLSGQQRDVTATLIKGLNAILTASSR